MLLAHQAGSVKVGEVVRYTLTYTPANDRILPTPSNLHVKIKNTSAIPLRAAWVHGPYALHVSAYPAAFNPYHKTDNIDHDGIPQYEPMLKAGGSWHGKLSVPARIRETGADLGKRRHGMSEDGVEREDDGKGRVTWIIEIASQILFSNSASVHFELLIGRDERSLDLGFAAVAGHGHGGPGQIKYQTTDRERKQSKQQGHVQRAGVYSKAVRLVVEDTEALWDKPALPSWDDEGGKPRKSTESKQQSVESSDQQQAPRKRKKIHLVVATHGLHSNLGADMLFLKESIDATVAQARLDAKKRKESYRAKKQASASETSDKKTSESGENGEETATAPLSGGQEDIDEDAEDSDEEETIVRGFPGNAVKTENGIQYLGKRLAKYILRFTYPDQPFLPIKKSLTRSLTDKLKTDADKARRDGMPSHAGSSIHHPSVSKAADELPYTFTSISFVGHSLGGLIQTYAVAYIYKHSPGFFTQIKPVNFICMASPMLGLSNENPMYVKFALDFGLVGRTGQDLGLTWRAPTLAKGGWNVMIGGLGSSQKDHTHEDPSSKPLLRILPTGPAHQVLRMFRNRTLYSNVVNDGIVPLRTSCLLFLDWRGLGKVDKARRENGLIGTVAEWGWAELTGQSLGRHESDVRVPSSPEGRGGLDDDSDDSQNEHVKQGDGETVPQPDEDETKVDNTRLTTRPSHDEAEDNEMGATQTKPQQESGIWDNIFSFFRPGTPEHSEQHNTSKKTTKALRRGQTIYRNEDEVAEDDEHHQEGTTTNPTMRPHMRHNHTGQVQAKRPQATRGDSVIRNERGEPEAPPKTSIFESAGDILHPPLPSRQWITDPTSRVRTIFHDRVYHPEDIPPPPAKRPGSRLMRSISSDSTRRLSQSSNLSATSQDTVDTGGMKVEEKIARAYHKDLSWRKVLVRLEPDAHNNMIVRRMFANAYGWPVVKHLCDTHFADTHAARTRDEHEPARERALPMDEPMPESGEEVAEQTAKHVPERTQSETREARDELADLEVVRDGASSHHSTYLIPPLSRQNSSLWDDAYFEGTDDDESDVDERNLVQRLINPMHLKKPEKAYQPASPPSTSKSNGTPRSPTSPYTDGHRGLAPISPTSPSAAKSAAATKPSFSTADIESPVIASRYSEEPESLGSTAKMGLGKSVEEQVSPTKGKAKAKSKPGSSSSDTQDFAHVSWSQE